MSWSPFDGGGSIGREGSESGVILSDEEHAAGARITLEANGETAPFAVTCGIYGGLVHTRFFDDRGKAESQLIEMKRELGRILTVMQGDQPDRIAELLEAFVQQYP